MPNGVIEVANSVRFGRVRAVEVVEAAVRRIESRNPALNAFVHVAAEQALLAARALDELRAAGRDPGPLAGVPFGVKDTHRCRALPITYGSLLYKDAAPSDTDEVFIGRLRAAGAIPIGVPAMPESW